MISNRVSKDDIKRILNEKFVFIEKDVEYIIDQKLGKMIYNDLSHTIQLLRIRITL